MGAGRRHAERAGNSGGNRHATRRRAGGRRHGGSGSDSDDQLDLQAFAICLAKHRLCVRDVESDGNCLFRAFADQLYGDESRHGELRAHCVQYMRQHEEDFAPFIEDDRSFASYVAEMSRDGVWGGNLELQALSMALGVNIRIHQICGTPSFDLRNHRNPKAPVVHLSYHRDQHYASVRPESAKHSRDPAAHPPLPPPPSDSNPNGNNERSSPESDAASSVIDDTALCTEVSNRAARIESTVANALQVLRSLHLGCVAHGRHSVATHHEPSETSTRLAASHCCHCHGHACKAGLQRHAITDAEDEAAAIRDILCDTERQSRKIALIHSDPNNDDRDHRLERRRKRLLESLRNASIRAAVFERHVHALSDKEAKLLKPASPDPLTTTQPPAKQNRKKVQESKRQERKLRRRQEQERSASMGKTVPTTADGSIHSTRIDI